MHPSDLARLGVKAEGEIVRVTSARTTLALPVRVDAAIAPGSAFLAIAQPGADGPGDLIELDSPVTELRIESTR